MAFIIEFKDKKGRIYPIEIGSNGFMQKDEFSRILSVIKTMEEREFDSFRKVWIIELNIPNLEKVKKLISLDEYKKLESNL